MQSFDSLHSRYQVVIVGARVAGSSLALQLARSGIKVLVVDRARPGLDTLSTHALMRGAIMLLHRWGLLERIQEADTPAIRKTTFHYGDAEFPVAIKEKGGVDALYAPRRTILDPLLAEAAAEAGADIRYRTSLYSLIRDKDERVTGVILSDKNGNLKQVEADIVVGADGIQSPVGRMAGSKTLFQATNAGAVIYGYFDGLELDGTHWYYTEKAGAGTIPTNGQQACVFASFHPDRLRKARGRKPTENFLEILSEIHPALGESVARARLRNRLFRFAGTPGFLRESHGPGWALLGDAGCFKDPITAHGMTDALRDSVHLAEAIQQGSDSAWEKYDSVHAYFSQKFISLSDRIAAYDWTLAELQPLHRDLSQLMNEECVCLENPLQWWESHAVRPAVKG